MTQKILIIEDDSIIFELLDPFLTRNGFKTIFAKDGFEGLLQFEKEHPHLVLLDLIRTCRKIRKISNVPIIFISCKNDAKDIIEGLDAGGDDYVVKPFKIDELLARIRSNLRRAPIYHHVNLHFSYSTQTLPLLELDQLKIDERNQKVFYGTRKCYSPLKNIVYFYSLHKIQIKYGALLTSIQKLGEIITSVIHEQSTFTLVISEKKSKQM